jgi:hypothetical protein
VEFKEERGPANIRLQWSATEVPKQTVPADRLYVATHLAGSPFQLNVVPGAADYPYSTAYGPGLVSETPVVGESAKFTIQAADQMGNNKTVGGDTFTVQLRGPADVQASGRVELAPYLTPEYIGGGQYEVSYTAQRAGVYEVDIRAGGTAEFHTEMSGTRIYCGEGASSQTCSPWTVEVMPGLTTRQTSTCSDIAAEPMDGLTEAAAGDVARFSIQAKDTFGNNRGVGGDDFEVILTHVGKPSVKYRGNIRDNNDSTYEVDYTALEAGYYNVDILYQKLPIISCPREGCIPLDTDWDTNSDSKWGPKELLIVHGALHAASSTATDDVGSVRSGSKTLGLSQAVVGLESGFRVQARDQFSNLRMGDRTPRFEGYGYGAPTRHGESDAFLVTFTGPGGYKVVTSTAVEIVKSTVTDSTPGWFTLSVGGKETAAMPHDVSESTMRMLLEEMHDFERTVEVHRDSAANKYSWSITFTSHLEEWSKNPLQVANKHGDMGFTIDSPADAGVYPVNYVLYYKGTYSMAVTAGGNHIIGSPFTVEVDDGAVEAKTSMAAGDGLTGGVVGEPFTFTVQAKDVRAVEEQTIKPAATVVKHVPAEVEIDMKTEVSTVLTFRGTSTTIANTDTYGQVDAKLEALFTIDAVTVDNNSGNANQAAAISTQAASLWSSSQVFK